jgi:hypothetical protein
MKARFKPGDAVSVRHDYPVGHIRTPVYIRGKQGVVTRVFGEYENPEVMVYDGKGLPKKTLYKVRFAQYEIWPDYNGPMSDTLDIDLYDHWLEKRG